MMHRKSPTSGRRGEAGFTLVELIITLSLAAILVGLATPTISETLERADARSVAREIANSFQRARNQAMSRGEVVMAEIDTSGKQGKVVLYRTNSHATTCRAAEADRGKLTEVSRTSVADLSGDMEIEGAAPNENWLCFAPDGRVLDQGAQVIRSSASNCGGMNFRLFLAHRNQTIDSNLRECRDGSNVSGTETSETTLDRQSAHFWIVHVPYNGAVSAYQ